MPKTPQGFQPHNHRDCVSASLVQAEVLCATAGLRLSPVRRRVLEILLEQHRAMGAYEVLERLKAEGFPAQPPIAYRALDFLVARGLVHRIEKRSAFVACACIGERHLPAFLICRGCDRVAETPTDPGDGPLAEGAAAAGFRIESAVHEAEGLCPACAGEAA